MRSDTQTLTDGILSCLGGVDGGTHPSLLNANQLAWAGNVTLRGGFPRTRPKLVQLGMTFDDPEVQNWTRTRRLQGAKIYKTIEGEAFIIFSVAGRIFKMSVRDFQVSEITPTRTQTLESGFITPGVGESVDIDLVDAHLVPVDYPLRVSGDRFLVTARNGNTLTLTNLSAYPNTNYAAGAEVKYLDPNSPAIDQCWMKQAETYFVIQNGVNQAILYNGSLTRRANISGTKPEVPVGEMMEYAMGRLWVAVDGRSVAAGDIYDPFTPESAIQFAEETQLDLSGRFTMPKSSDRITGLKVTANLDTVEGQGSLLMFSNSEIASINVPVQRSLWRTVTYPTVRLVQSNYGTAGQDSITLVNGDVWNRALDGIRSFFMASAKWRTWANVPQSTELDRVLLLDSSWLLKYCSSILFDNRLLTAYGPLPTSNGVKHAGVVALDFDIVSGLLKSDMPVYDGNWFGINPTILLSDICDDVQRAFAFSLNTENNNELWELQSGGTFDNTDSRIPCYLESRSMDFRSPFDLKRLSGVEVWVDEAVGTVDFRLLWKPDYSPCWYEWGTAQICVKYQECDPTDECTALAAYNPGYRTRIGFGEPPETAEPHDSRPARICYRAQVRLEWTGNAAVKALLLKARPVPETEFNVTC